MANGIFLVNPSLNVDEVALSASSQLGRRVAAPIPYAANSNLMKLSAIGDPGDDLARDVEVLGSQKQPLYSPYTTGGSKQYTDITTYAALGTITAGSSARIALAVTNDRLFAIVADGTSLKVYRWTGSTFSQKGATATIVDSAGGISACGIGENVYIAIGNNTDSQVDFFRYNDAQETLSLTAEGGIGTNSPGSLSIATNGAAFVVLVENGTDTEVWSGGNLAGLELNTDTLGSANVFNSTPVQQASVAWNQLYGFVVAARVGAASPGAMKLATSEDGETWTLFKNIKGSTSQPTTASGWADVMSCAVTVENRRVYVFRGTGTQDGAPTDVKMQWFDGQKTWSSEVDVDGAVAVNQGTALAAANWRGTMYVGWRNSSTQITVRKGNALTTTNTGYYRELIIGAQNFVAGLDDDSQTALFVVPTGRVNAGDKWQIPVPEYDHRVEYLLSDFLSQTWRGDDNGARTIDLDFGASQKWVLDAIAIFGSNLPSITLKLDDDSAFGSPSTNQAISATIQTATVVSVDKNRIVFAAGTFKAHEHAASKRWVQFTSGITAVFRILDNTTDSLLIDGDATGASAASCTIFGDRMGYIFSSVQTPQRYLRLLTPTLVLPDDYYEMSRVVFAVSLALPRNFSNGFVREHVQVEARVDLKAGARFMTKLNDTQRDNFVLPWQVMRLTDDLKPIRGLYGVSQGARQLVAFWPLPPAATGDQPDVYLGRIIAPILAEHEQKDFYRIGGMRFESEV